MEKMMRPLTQRIENLSPAKRALLAAKLRAQTNADRIPVRLDNSVAPLSFHQQGLWFLEQLQPDTAIYNLPDVMRCSGALNYQALEKTLAKIVARHESLRTTFHFVGNEPQQHIVPDTAISLQLFDVSTSSPNESAALQLLRNEAARPFDLAQFPLVRFTLVKLADNEHLLMVLMHHIISDGWSIGIFWQEFTQFYEHFQHETIPAVAALPVQFGDYTEWLRTTQTEKINAQLAYWKTQLADAPPLLELPTDYPRSAVQSFQGAQSTVYFPPDLCEQLKAFSQAEGATLFMTLLAAFNVLLQRYTGQADLIVGAPLAGRTRTEIEPLIGFFVNTLALRTDASGDPTFRELLQRVRATALSAYSHQDVPMEKIVAELRPERSLSYNPIFQTAFALQTENTAELKISDLQLTPLKLGSVTAKFDLFLSLCETPDGLRATVEYNTDLFAPETIQRWLQHYQNLLQGVLLNPLTRISTLPLLSATELQQILLTWNNTSTDYPRTACLHALFDEQAARTPDAIAVEAGEVGLTYRELKRRANQVAHYLQQQGVRADTPVAVFTERSLLMIIGILGVIKAGGAYVPLDQNYPLPRLQFMLADTQAPVILTQQRLQSALPASSAKIICLDSDWEIISKCQETAPITDTNQQSLAYIIYTSGSTGQPKGAAIPHQAVTRLVRDTNYIQLDETDCLAQISNASFDAATFEIWGTLLNGAKLVMIQKDIALTPHEFVAQLRQQKISAMFVTTALFNLLAREIPAAFSTVKTVIVGGDACDPAAMQIVLNNGAPARLLNGYGPTESTTFAAWHLIESVPAGATNIPIGQPISNTTLFVLDRNLQPVPVGVLGELYIGGDGLAREYWNRPELTAEKFVQVDFAPHLVRLAGTQQHTAPPLTLTPTPTRLYKTGDIVRRLPNGDLEFIGRQDGQIKLRGFRIELGEIETILLTHPVVDECVVIAAAGTHGDKKLVAYYVAAKANVSADELRTHIKQRLPDFMLPAAFCQLEKFPLTPNGKIARQQLPAVQEIITAASSGGAQAADELELQLTWLWEKTLGHTRLSIDDNFFSLGGHSLMAVRLFSSIEKQFGQRLPLATLFQAPTIRQLADILRAQGWQPAWQSLVPLRANGTKPPLFCVHAVGGNVLEYNDLARHLLPDQPFYGLQSRGLDGNSAPLSSIETMAAAYITEMQTIQPHGPYYLSGRSFGGSVAYEMARQLFAQGETVALLAMLDSYPLGWLHHCAPEEMARYEKEFFKLRVTRHFANLQQLGFIHKFHYIAEKARYKNRKLKNWLWQLRSFLHLQSAQNLRSAIQHIEELNYLAAKQYRPQIYQGKVTFFCAAEEINPEENILGWQRLASGGVDIVPIAGDHQTMIREPYVQTLAAQLTYCLAQAQQIDPARQTSAAETNL